MTTTTVREGRHQCDLPSPLFAEPGEIERCDDCGRLWRFPGFGSLFRVEPNYVRVGWLRTRWINRRERKSA